MNNNILMVLDLETTGLEGFPIDVPVEISIYEINFETHQSEKKLTSLINWPEYKEKIDSSWWSDQSGVTYKDTINSPLIEDIWPKITELLHKKNVTSWNVGYDFYKFINRMERKFGKISFILQECPMIISTDIICIPSHWGGNKWPTLQEAESYYGIDMSNHQEEAHRADYDTKLASEIIIEMIKRNQYTIQRSDN